MPKLIVILTQSNNDWGVLKKLQRCPWPDVIPANNHTLPVVIGVDPSNSDKALVIHDCQKLASTAGVFCATRIENMNSKSLEQAASCASALARYIINSASIDEVAFGVHCEGEHALKDLQNRLRNIFKNDIDVDVVVGRATTALPEGRHYWAWKEQLAEALKSQVAGTAEFVPPPPLDNIFNSMREAVLTPCDALRSRVMHRFENLFLGPGSLMDLVRAGHVQLNPEIIRAGWERMLRVGPPAPNENSSKQSGIDHQPNGLNVFWKATAGILGTVDEDTEANSWSLRRIKRKVPDNEQIRATMKQLTDLLEPQPADSSPQNEAQKLLAMAGAQIAALFAACQALGTCPSNEQINALQQACKDNSFNVWLNTVREQFDSLVALLATQQADHG